MSRLPIVDSKKFEKALFALGFVFVRQKGSHAYYTTPPHHPGRDLGRSLIHKILREVNVTPEEFVMILEKR